VQQMGALLDHLAGTAEQSVSRAESHQQMTHVK
jgi:hypothetical protein